MVCETVSDLIGYLRTLDADTPIDEDFQNVSVVIVEHFGGKKDGESGHILCFSEADGKE